MKHSSRNDNRQPERSWAEICLGCTCLQLFWPRLVMRKWLNISAKDSDYSADTEDDDDIFSDDANINTEEMCKWPRESRLKDNYSSQIQNDLDDGLPRMRRRKSETFRAQYINSKEIRICAGTWNVGGKLPPEDQDIEGWLDIGDPADIYVIGFQEIIPLNAGNIFGAEDSRPVSKWENIIRETLNKIRPTKTKFKCYSDPPSPSRFKPSDDIPEIEDELLLETDSEDEKEMHPLNEEFMEFDEARDELLPSLSSDDANLGVPVERDLKKQFSSPNKLDRLNCLRTEECTGNELLLETDSEDEEEIHPLNEESMEFDEARDEILTSLSSDDAKFGVPVERDLKKQFSSPKKLDRLNCLPTEECTGNADSSVYPQNRKLTKTLSASERIGLSWPEPPLHLLAQRVLERPNSLRSFQAYSSSKSFRSFKDSKSFQAYRSSKSFQAYSSFKSYTNGNNRVQSDAALLAELDLEALMYRKKRPPFVRIVSKQMVGVFLTVWVRRSLRRHIQNLKVSTVGVGVMGYIGNKGSISVSMSIYQTLFCFICTHLTSGEKDADTVKRNADVNEIHRRTHFHSGSSIGLPKRIHDHERIIWLGDLNYRINLSYEKTRQLISRKDWSKLVESDQLIRELRKGRAFDGWSEGVLKFPPTYKYELNSDKYCGEDPKAGRRIPAWCDRILSFGKGMRLLNYRRSELRLSDHRPVTASFMVEVEVFSPRKLQRALTFTDAEIEDEEAVADMGIDVGMSRLRAGEDINDWDR